jgi:hypothetical protein
MGAESTHKNTGCNGQDLKRLAWAGLAWLERNYETVNALNVFPVPDGDTGTNMLLTMRSAYNEVAGSDEAHAGQVAHKIYNGALMGARGNSGVILSQLWRGFARGIADQPSLDAQGLARGMREATRAAYQAVQEPVEGTMLTVAREASEAIEAMVTDTDDLINILERTVAVCHDSVRRTPELLAVLREAGVVDSGGMGLAFILEGMLRYLKGESVEATAVVEVASPLQSALEPEDEAGYGYDVQFLLRGSGFDVDAVRAKIESLGWSTLVVGDSNLVKVHVHVHNPGEVLGYGASMGDLHDIVVENMQAQYQQFVQERGGPRMPEPEPIKMPVIEPGTIAAVTVAPGEGLTRIFYSLGAGYVVAGGQTMNPSTRDLIQAVESLPTDKVVILPNNKNIFLAAEQAASQVNGKQVRVVASRTIPQGVSALLALDPHGDLDETVETMHQSCQIVHTGEVTTSTRNARLDGLKVSKGQIIGLHDDRLSVAGEEVNQVVFDLLEAMDAGSLELITLYYGEDVSMADAQALRDRLAQLYPDHEIEVRNGGQPHYFYILSAE